MSDLPAPTADWSALLRLPALPAWPGRLRRFASRRVLVACGLDPAAWEDAAASLAWSDLVALACAAAWAEAPRGGRVLLVLHADDGQDEPDRAAAVLALPVLAGQGNLGVLVLAPAAGCAAGPAGPAGATPATNAARAWGETAWWRTLGWQVAPTWESAARRPCLLGIVDALPGVPPPAAQPDDGTRAWQPVRLASLPPGGLPPWPRAASAAGDGLAVLVAALAWLAEREPRLLVVAGTGPWRADPAGAGGEILAVAALAREGYRVVLWCPPGAVPERWWPVLERIAGLGLALKLLIAAQDLPPAGVRARLVGTGCWMSMPADAAEAEARLAQTLDTEDTACIAAATTVEPGLPVWPHDLPAMPGEGRWLQAPPPAPRLLCCALPGDGQALARWADRCQGAGIATGRLLLTSVLPLPLSQILVHPSLVAIAVVSDGEAGDSLATALREALLPWWPGPVIVLPAHRVPDDHAALLAPLLAIAGQTPPPSPGGPGG